MGLFGRFLRHAAFHGGVWLVLVGRQGRAFKFGARDHCIGWSSSQQFSRLHLFASNARYELLGQDLPLSLASRALGQSLRQQCPGMQAVH